MYRKTILFEEIIASITLLFFALLTGGVQVYDIFVLAFINFILITYLFYKINFKLNRALVNIFFIFGIYLIYALFLSESVSDVTYVVYRFYDIFVALMLVNYFTFSKISFFKIFENLIIIILVHNILNFIVSNTLFSLFSPILLLDGYTYSLFNVFFAMGEQYLGIHRNQSFFWEPGVNQFFLNIGLFFYLFYKLDIRKAFACMIMVFSTLSTTGVIISTFLIITFSLKNIAFNKKGFRNMIMGLLFFPIIAFNTLNIAEDKFIGERVGSSNARYFDSVNGLAIALNNPFGIGFNHEKYQEIARSNIYRIDVSLQTDRGQTNGIIMLFYTSGFIWGFVFLYYLFRNNIFKENTWIFNVLFFISMLSEPILFSPFFFMFIIFSMLRKDIKLFDPI